MVAELTNVKPNDKGRDKPASEKAETLRSLIDGFAAHDAKVALLSFTRSASSSFTYKTFVDEIRNMAAELRVQGVKKGDNLVFFAPNSPAWIISALAVIYSGATVVPIDSQQSDEVLAHIIADSSADWIFTDERGNKR